MGLGREKAKKKKRKNKDVSSKENTPVGEAGKGGGAGRTGKGGGKEGEGKGGNKSKRVIMICHILSFRTLVWWDRS